MEQKKFIIKALGGSQTKYVTSAGRNYITTAEDIGDAIELDNTTQAITFLAICKERNNNGYELSIITKRTLIEDYEEPKIRGNE